MIFAVGLTPAWQQILVFERFTPGEVNRAQRTVWCGSGKVLNVACALHHLGSRSKGLCVVGGLSGQQIQVDLQTLNVPIRWIESIVPSRICTTILDQSTNVTTELVENSKPIPSEELELFDSAFAEEILEASFLVLSGSLPVGTPVNYYRRLLERVSVKAILDIRGPELEQALLVNPFVIKPNREEVSKTVGRELTSDNDLIEAMSELRRRGAEWVVVSSGAAELFALGPDKLIRMQPPQVEVCNPIGCGDCLAAGIATGLDRGMPMANALEIGIQAAAENARHLLPARNLTRIRF